MCVAEKISGNETGIVRIPHGHKQKDVFDIIAATVSLIYGPGIDDSIQVIVTQNFTFFHYYLVVKSSQKLLNRF